MKSILLTRLLLLALAYFITGWLGLQMPYAGSHITLIWLPTGIAVAALLRWGTAVWPGITLGALLVHLAVDAPWPPMAGIVIGNTLGPLLTRWWLQRTGFQPAFERQRDIVSFIAAASLGMTVSAAGGYASLRLAGMLPPETESYAWLMWWMGDTVGVLLAAPLLLTLSRDSLQQLLRVRRELLLWLLAASLVGWLAFVHDYAPQQQEPLPVVFLTLPLFAWAALRFGITGTTLAGLGFSVAAAWGTAAGHGVFLQNDTHLTLILLWSYMTTTVLTGLLITALLAEQRQLTRTLRDSELQLRIAATAFQSREGMVIANASGKILRINRAFTAITGYTAEEMEGQTLPQFPSDHPPHDFDRAAIWETLQRTGSWQGEFWDRRKNGEAYPKWLTLSAVTDSQGRATHYIGTHYDITERKKAEERIQELAFFDQLTGLPNRVLLMDRLKQAMAASARDGSYGALLFIDLDHFKTLNDTLGHDTGDLLLQQVAQRLRQCVRETDTVARLGGDEFVVILARLGQGEAEAASHTQSIASKMRDALNQPYQLSHVVHYSTPSMGVTLFRGQQIAIDELLKQADLAMYQSKAAGRNAVLFFDPVMAAALEERTALEGDLRQAMAERQFLLHYQPQVMLGGRVTGAEVLLRWHQPQRGQVSPADFIPVAEETGLILPLGHWVLETACTQLAQWARQPGMADLTLAVNVSANQFRQPDFVAQVLAILEQTGANPQRLKLELTESLLISQVEVLIGKMSALKARGLGFALDDFGTGYSSLSYLKRLPLDQLKIDQSFVREVLSEPHDAAIARTIITLGQSLGLEVIAEGVETALQQDFLARAGCHAYQGYLFSRALPLADFEQHVRANLRLP